MLALVDRPFEWIDTTRRGCRRRYAQPVPVSFRALTSSVSDPEMRRTILAQRRHASGCGRCCGCRAARCANSDLDCIGDRVVSMPVGLRRSLLRRSLLRRSLLRRSMLRRSLVLR
jgi:hypothetical protein